jgi:hypothetical protein
MNTKELIGQTLRHAALRDNVLYLTFADGRVAELRDDGQSCCETRYLTSDDALDSFTGADLRAVEVRGGGCSEEGSGFHEIEFLVITTTIGAITVATHNEHNGYYGGFALNWRWA